MIGAVFIIRERMCAVIQELTRSADCPYSLSSPCGCPHLLLKWMLMSLFLGVKRPGHEAYHFPPFSDETKKALLFHMHLARSHSAIPYVVCKCVYRTCA